MKLSLHIIAILTLSITLFACQSQQIDLEAVKTAIEEANAKFAEAFNQGDAAGVAALYTDDGRIYPPNSAAVQGRASIEAFLNTGFTEAGLKGLSLTTNEVHGLGDMVYEVGEFTLEIAGMEDSGKYIVIWKQDENGAWKLHEDIWNSSMPLPGTEISEK